MFSVENLYYILYVNLFKLINADIEYFNKFGSIDISDLVKNFDMQENFRFKDRTCFYCYDQEPVQNFVLDNIFTKYPKYEEKTILVTSEYSELVDTYCIKKNIDKIYYFFHGFACLHWYKDFSYFPKIDPKFENKFLSLNRLCISERSYRLLLVTEYIRRNLLEKGMVSLQIMQNNKNIVKEEVFDHNSKLSKDAKIQVFKTLGNLNTNFVVDRLVLGDASAHAWPKDYNLWQTVFLHVVSETVFFERKLHLTEKIFKPIVSLRPFILLGAYKNLNYLKSYGFQTFEKWIDESYDNEQDNEKRLMMACDEIEKIANLSEDEIKTMYLDMQQVLEHNYRHFYTDFKKIIINELVDNFQEYLNSYNVKQGQNVYDIDSLNLPEVKKLLAQ